MTRKSMQIKNGIYQHYKGHKYRVLGVAKHSESLEELVVYQSLDNNDLWVRPIKMFLEDVPNLNGDGSMVPRFKYLEE